MLNPPLFIWQYSGYCSNHTKIKGNRILAVWLLSVIPFSIQFWQVTLCSDSQNCTAYLSSDCDLLLSLNVKTLGNLAAGKVNFLASKHHHSSVYDTTMTGSLFACGWLFYSAIIINTQLVSSQAFLTLAPVTDEIIYRLMMYQIQAI